MVMNYYVVSVVTFASKFDHFVYAQQFAYDGQHQFPYDFGEQMDCKVTICTQNQISQFAFFAKMKQNSIP